MGGSSPRPGEGAYEPKPPTLPFVFGRMPRISQFHGLFVYRYHDDHGPPHFHVHEGENQGAFLFTGELLHGRMSVRARRLVREWALLRHHELELNWELARRLKPLVRIAPLK